MITRRIGRILRGKATPFHLISATVLAGLYAFHPGWAQSPLLSILLPLLVIIINANLIVFAFAFILAQVLHWILLPLQFQIGLWLIEGPLQGFFAFFANAPITAWLGLEYYVVSSGILLGIIYGGITGWLLSRYLQKFRHTMGSLEKDSEKYQKIMERRWVRILGWALLGGVKAQGDWNKLAEKKIGNPLRPLGLIFAAALVVLLVLIGMILDSAIVSSYVRDNLSRLNGATVDIGDFDLKLLNGSLDISSLAAADPENLQENRFSSDAIAIRFSSQDFLRRRFVIDEVTIATPRSGTPRTLRGSIYTRPESPAPDQVEPDPDAETLQLLDYLEDARIWKERLQTAYQLYQQWGPRLGKQTEAETRSNWRDNLRDRAQISGYQSLASETLIRQSPRIVLRSLEALDFQQQGQPDSRWDITAKNLASEPSLLEESAEIQISDHADIMELKFELQPLDGSVQPLLRLSRKNWSVAEIRAGMENPDRLPVKSGTIDILAEGIADPDALDLPLYITLRNADVAAFNQTLKIAEITFPARLVGRLDSPGLKIETKAWTDALQEAAGNQIREEVRERATDEIRRRLPSLPFGGG
jgi:uncharacterized protein (TIGR03546 family)